MRLLKLLPIPLLAASLAFAQDQGSGPRRGPVNPDERLQRMATQLSLTDDQKTQIKPILEKEASQMKELRDDTSLSREEKMQKMQTIMADSREKITPILTEEQRKKMAEARQQMQERGGRRRQQQ